MLLQPPVGVAETGKDTLFFAIQLIRDRKQLFDYGFYLIYYQTVIR